MRWATSFLTLRAGLICVKKFENAINQADDIHHEATVGHEAMILWRRHAPTSHSDVGLRSNIRHLGIIAVLG